MGVCFTFSFLLQLLTSRSPKLSFVLSSVTFLALIVLTVPLTMAQAALIDFMSPLSRPDVSCLLVQVGIYLLLASMSMSSSGKWLSKKFSPSLVDGLLSGAVNLFFATLTFIAFHFLPEQQISDGLHQELGVCRHSESDLLGASREKYQCATSMRTKSFILGQQKAARGRWYTIQGVEDPLRQEWILSIVLLSIFSIVLFTYLLTGPASRSLVALPTQSKVATPTKKGNKKKTQ